jgi:predicted molibdopterin-dependent oxidoreductase YjgC
MPDPRSVERNLSKVPLRVHQDIVLTNQMMVEPGEEVILLPAMTRYEQPGGGTETTTERRIAFSPEIPGPRIGEARAEWRIFLDLAARVRPEDAELIFFPDAQAIREEIARATPAYEGIQHLRKSGDQVQWGGPHLCPGGRCETPDGRAHFRAVTPPEMELGPGQFRVATRRGKQFNSMVHAKTDPLTGASRDHVLMSPDDAQVLGVGEGDRVRLRNALGEMECRVKLAPMRPRNLQLHWPEANVLLGGDRIDERAGVPDYNATVEVAPLRQENWGGAR